MTVVAYLLVLAGGWLALGNWTALVRGLSGRRSGSPTPLVPGLLLAGGLALLAGSRHWWWVGLLLDPTVPLLPYSATVLIRDLRRSRRSGPPDTGG